MIDNRPVFDYLQGGTFWQNLPVDIVDVERIEVVAGPTSALYGPNAVNGVINIITKRTPKEGIYFTGRQYIGNASTIGSSAGIGYQKGKFSSIVSFNYNRRDRFVDEYYRNPTEDYVSIDSAQGTGEILKDYPLPGVALEKRSGNVFINYDLNKDVKFSAAGGMNNSYALYPLSVSNNMNNFTNNSYYGLLRGEVYGFGFQTSISRGNNGLVGNNENYSHDYNNFDSYLDYNLKLGSKLSIRPAINFQEAYINDKKYTVEVGQRGVFNNSASLYNLGTSLKADFNTNKFRAIAAIRADKFQYPDTTYLSYQLIANYKINKKNIVRVFYGRSNGGSFLVDTYANFEVAFVPGIPNQRFTYTGNKDRKLPINDMIEVGYRAQIGKTIQVDLALFHQQMSQFTKDVYQEPVFDIPTFTANTAVLVSDLKLKAIQNGATIALNMNFWNNKINFRPSFTYQVTNLENYTPNYFTATWNPTGNIDSTYSTKHTASPNIYGSVYLNFSPNEKLNINFNSNFFDATTMYTLYNVNTGGFPFKTVERNAGVIPSGIILNAKVSYAISDAVTVYVNARNFGSSNTRQYFASDRIQALLLGGISVNY